MDHCTHQLHDSSCTNVRCTEHFKLHPLEEQTQSVTAVVQPVAIESTHPMTNGRRKMNVLEAPEQGTAGRSCDRSVRACHKRIV